MLAEVVMAKVAWFVVMVDLTTMAAVLTPEECAFSECLIFDDGTTTMDGGDCDGYRICLVYHGEKGPKAKTTIKWPLLDHPLPQLPFEQRLTLLQQWDSMADRTDEPEILKECYKYVEAIQIKTEDDGTIRTSLRFRNAIIEYDMYTDVFSDPDLDFEMIAVWAAFTIIQGVEEKKCEKNGMTGTKLLEYMRIPRANTSFCSTDCKHSIHFE